MSKFKILLVAPWGYPPSWKIGKYVVNSGFGGVQVKGVCSGCSSSIALFSLLRSNSIDTELLVISSDTVKPVDQEPPVHEWLREVVGKLFEETRCENISIDPNWDRHVYIGVVPGIGRYFNYTYRGDAFLMFIEAYRHILRRVKEMDPSLIVLDATHGLNILTITTLYATVAVSIMSDKKLQIYNSEPYPYEIKARTCIQKHEIVKREEIPELSILDATRLQKVIEYLRAISLIKYLNEKPLAKLLKSKVWKSRELTHVIEQVICMVEALRAGLVGLVYGDSWFSDNAAIPFNVKTVKEEMRNIGDIALDEPWISSRVDHSNKVVSYYPVVEKLRLEEIPIYTALKHIFESGDFQGLEEIGSIKEFGRRIARLLERIGYWDKKQIIVNEVSSLVETIKKIIEEEKAYEIDNNLLETYWSRIKGYKTPGEERSREETISPRNLAAHAGLSYSVLEKIIVKDRNSVERVKIVYSLDRLRETLRNIRETHLLKCLEKR